MQKSKLLLLLQELTDAESKSLSNSVYCNQHEGKLSTQAGQLFRFLRKHNFHLSQQDTRERVWAKLFPGQKYRDGLMRKYMHELNRFTLEFLGIQHLQKDQQALRLATLQAVYGRGLDKHAGTLERQSQRYFNRSALRDHTYHHQSMAFHALRFRQNEHANHHAQLAQLLHRQDYHLECYYLMHKMRNYCNSIGYRFFVHLEGDQLNLPAGFLDRVAQGPWLQEAGVLIYYLVARMLEQPREQHWYFRLKETLDQYSGQFSLDELDSLYIFLKNYCITQHINQGRSHYFQELFDISRTLLEKGITQRSGMIEPQAYKNIITVGLHVQEFSWTEQFIRDYTHYLPEEERANALSYNLAKVAFHRGHYASVIEQLSKVAYANHTYALGSKLMLLKTYYETGEDRALDSLIESFRIYLRRHRKISKEVQTQYRNVLRFVRKLFYLPPHAPEALAKLRADIEQCEALADKAWILAKVDELEKRDIASDY